MTDHGTLSIAPPPATFAVTSLVYGSARNHGAYAIAAPPRTFVLSGYSIAGTAECPDCPDCPPASRFTLALGATPLALALG